MNLNDVRLVVGKDGTPLFVQIPLADCAELLAQAIELQEWKAAQEPEVAAVARVMEEAAAAYAQEQAAAAHQSVTTA